MITKIYTFYDSAAQAYTTPFFMHNDGLAIRAFQDNINAKEENNISKHPDQFTLFCIGEIDDSNAQIATYEPAKNLGNGLIYEAPATEADKADLAMIHERIDEIAKIIKKQAE